MLAQKLKSPITWKAGDTEINAFLDHLQGNILKYHGRNNVAFVFCQFDPGSKGEALTFLRSQVARVHSAHDQLLAAEKMKLTPPQKDTRPFVCLYMTKAGYDYFGVPGAKQPQDPAFKAGMAASEKHLSDPPKSEWDSHIRNPHVLILVATGGPDEAEEESTALLNSIGEIGNVLAGHSGELLGNQFFNGDGRGIENFGYVDGRSQPLVLTEDLQDETDTNIWPGTGREFPVDQFVVRDPGVADATAYGSYFVFRQLEQDVLGFKTREDEINAGFDDDNNHGFPNRDSAGVGRLESGTPYELSNDDGGGAATVTNNFVFDTQPPHCPHFAHIRKVNPRTDASRGHLMIRRGMTYGTRKDAVPRNGDRSVLVLPDNPKPADMPTVGGRVGLLFQSYQANITNQFEVTQRWANSPTNGVDPVIGQVNSAQLDWPTAYGSTKTKKEEFFSRKKGAPAGPYVKLMGGGYFFAPSLPFLKSL